MFTIETLVARLMELESRFYELQSRYQSLINDYETLKEEHARCVGHRNEHEARPHLAVRDAEH